MGYPYGDTYLMQIQKNKQECKKIVNTYYVLRQKYCSDNKIADNIELGLKEQFMILGEALELASDVVGDIADSYHFMWDVLDELFDKTFPDYSDDSVDNRD